MAAYWIILGGPAGPVFSASLATVGYGLAAAVILLALSYWLYICLRR